jgi:hypothetical protein
LFNNTRLFLLLIAFALSLGGCATPPERGQSNADVPACFIIYDAGSSGSRLFIYQQTATGWLNHPGPKTEALADPVRGNRGKTMADADTVVGSLVSALDDVRHVGPLDENGKPQWVAFDWQQQCRIEAAAVYATAGMRLAERLDAEASRLLWKKLNERLGATLGVPVTTRTLTEYEEGLYAWLASRESQVDARFGVAEMGGASLQVTFPCPLCEGARRVRVKGVPMDIFSYSFLGWGQDEAWKKIGDIPACQRGAGKENPAWRLADCESGMTGFAATVSAVAKMIRDSGDLRWRLTDAFSYMQATDIDSYCREGIDSGFKPKSACFRAAYLQYVLDTLALPAESEPSNVNWTLGAVVCHVTRCLETQ